MKQFENRGDAQTLALAIVDTLPDPFLVLDDNSGSAPSRCFYEIFQDDPTLAHGLSVFAITGGRWDLSGLRERLQDVVPGNADVDGFEFEQEFAGSGDASFT